MNWAEMMRLAVGMGMPPDGFWRLSLKEWRWLTARDAGPAPMGRAGLDEMMRRWPDGPLPPQNGEGGRSEAETG